MIVMVIVIILSYLLDVVWCIVAIGGYSVVEL